MVWKTTYFRSLIGLRVLDYLFRVSTFGERHGLTSHGVTGLGAGLLLLLRRTPIT